MESDYDRFVALVAPGSGQIAGELDIGSSLIAAVASGNVDGDKADPDRQVERLDDLAEQADAGSLSELLGFLFGECGFAGARDSYYDRDNSFLNRVLDRRRGIPISLAVVTIEVARRCGVVIEGVGMPGHFLVRSEGTFVDVFGGGVLLDERGCRQLLEQMAGRSISLPDDALDPTPPAAILRRMLMNLKVVGERDRDPTLFRNALTLLAAFPEASAVDLLALAQSQASGAQFDLAAKTAERAMAMLPEARREAIGAKIIEWQARLN